MRQLIGIIIAVSVIWVAPGITQERNSVVPEWAFTDERMPTHDKLNDAGPKYSEIDCDKWPDTLYANYAKLNPGFRPLMDKENWREKWRRSLVLNSDNDFNSTNHCIYLKLSKRISDSPFASPRRILFCGVITNGIDGKELKSARAAEELFDYAMHKRFLAFLTLLNWETRTSPIKYNADVKYYLQLMINKHWPEEHRLHHNFERYLVPDASKALLIGRKKFVIMAFERGDYQAVLSTTKPCK